MKALILLAAVLIQAVMYGAHFSFTVFFPSLLGMAGGNRAWLSGVYTLFTLVYMTFMFPVGLVADPAGSGLSARVVNACLFAIRK